VTQSEEKPTTNGNKPGSVIRNRNFQFLWAGQTISAIGDQMSGLALPVLAVTMLAASEWQVGMMNAAGLSMFLLIGLPAGAWVDRWRKRRVMILADIVRMLAVLSVPIVYFTADLQMWYLILVAAIMSVANVFFDVAYQSVLPLMLPKDQMAKANSALETTMQTARIGGPAVVGFLLTIVKAPVLMFIDSFSFLVSLFAISRIKIDESAVPKKDRKPLKTEIVEGVRFVAKHPIISRITLSTSVYNFFSTGIHTLSPILVLRTMDVSPALYGVTFTIGAVAGLAGAVSAAKIGERLGQGNTVIAAMVLSGVAAFGFPIAAMIGNASALPIVFVSEALIAFCGLVYNITQVSARQALCPEHLLGRMNASIRFFVWGVMPISALAAGAFASGFGMVPVMLVGAIGAMTASWFVFASPLRGMKNIVAEAAK
jgi:MFS family permease